MDDDLGDMSEARRRQRRRSLAQGLQKERPRLYGGAAENDLGRRKKSNQVGDGEAERIACGGENADEALVAVLREFDDPVELLADFGETVAIAVDRAQSFGDDRGFRGNRSEPVAAVAGGVGADEQVAEIRREA